MALPTPTKAKSCSRRSFLRTAAIGGSVAVGGMTHLPNTRAAAVETPSIPAQFDSDAWERRELGQKSSDGFSWKGVALNNVELSEKVEAEVGYNEPLWQLYSWKLDAPHEDYADSGSNSGSGDWIPWFDVDSISLGANGGLLSASIELSNLGEDSDGVKTERGKKSLSIYGDQVESDFPFTKVTSCEGLNEDELFRCRREDSISFSTPTADVEEKYTIREDYSTDDHDVDYRGFFVLQTFDESESFVISGTVFPDSKVNRTWPKSDYVFEKDFIDESRPFIKSAGSTQ